MIDWGRRILLGSLLGALFGVLLGLGLARLLWPPTPPLSSPAPTPFPSPRPDLIATDVPTYQSPVPEPTNSQLAIDNSETGLLLISALYAHDGDLPRAQERLSALGHDDPSQSLADLALLHASQGQLQLAADLAALAADLGHPQTDLLAYLPTPTPPATPLPSATPSPIPTTHPLPSPTLSPSPSVSLSPSPPPPASPAPTRRPPTSTPRPPAATPLPLVWDHRVDLLNPPIRLLEAGAAPGQAYWRLVRLEWWKAGEGGNTLLYITALNQDGQPAWGQPVIVEHGEKEILYTDFKPGEPYGANYPMFSTLNSYQVYVGGDLPSERVTGLGLGEWRGSTDHTTFVLVFQKSIQH